MNLSHSLLMSAAIACGSFAVSAAQAATPAPAMPAATAAAVKPIDETNVVRLTGSTHRLATPANDRGALALSTPMPNLTLTFKRSTAQEGALTSELKAQLDPSSPEFHKWMHAVEFGQRYGISDAALARVTQWLEGHGFHIDDAPKGRSWIKFSGTAGQVNDTFHVTMRHYQVNGKDHFANDRDPSIPAELASTVAGFVSLNNIRPEPHVSHTYVARNLKTGKYHQLTDAEVKDLKTSGIKPDNTFTDPNGLTQEWVTPYDAATIYNYKSLWSQGIIGTGETIAITGTSDISTADVNTFRSSFGLPAIDLTIVQTGTDPGYNGGRNENSMDVELSGGAAPGAKIVLVVSGGTDSTPGFFTSPAYIIENELAPIISTSYGGCELDWGTSGNQSWAQLWQQADAEGISSFISSGDSGSDSCDSQDPRPNAATSGEGISGVASTPYATAVGGTDFFWQNSPTTYWSATNDSNGASALGYVPEVPWNSTCTSSIVYSYYGYTDGESFCNDAYSAGSPYDSDYVLLNSGNGGVSSCTTPSGTTPSTCSGGYAKPSWQTGTGVPADGKRDVPDISLLGSGGIAGEPSTAWLICDSEDNACNYSSGDTIVYQGDGGTSASSPAMAGIMALIQQEKGAQGLVNPTLYSLFSKETVSNCSTLSVNTTSNSCVFYDITAETNSQVCVSGSPNCVVETSGDQFGTLSGWNSTTGYDLTTGLGSVNVANLLAAWPSSKVATTTTLTSSANPAAVSANVNFTATVKKNSGSGTPTGSITFAAGGTTLSTVALSNGSASLDGVMFSSTGTYQITATYAGDSTDSGSTSNTVNEVINASAVSTATTLTSSSNPAAVNAGVNFTATVKATSGSTPAGDVTFAAGGTTLSTVALSNGSASLDGVMFSSTGTYQITATYAGDSTDSGSTSNTVNEVIQASSVGTTTTLSAIPTSVVTGGSVKFTAVVKAASGSTTPAGSVSFTLNGASLGSVTLSSGTASLTSTVSLAAGTYTATATYGGGTGFSGSTSSSITITVTAAAGKLNTTTTLTASPNPVATGSTLTLSATVKPSSGSVNPTGNVSFSLGGVSLGSVALSSGTAKLSTTVALSAGTYTAAASYAGDSGNNSSTSSSVSVTITAATTKVNTTTTLAVTPNPITVNATGTLTATVKKSSGSGVATGSVTFYAGGEAVAGASLNSSGVAVASAQAAVPAGTYPLYAVYSGDTNDNTSTSNTVDVTVQTNSKSATTTTVSASPNPVKSGADITISVKVAGGSATPTGTVTFSSAGTALGSATLSGGFASVTTPVNYPAGSYVVTIGYGGDSTHSSSSTTLTVKVD